MPWPRVRVVPLEVDGRGGGDGVEVVADLAEGGEQLARLGRQEPLLAGERLHLILRLLTQIAKSKSIRMLP